MPPRTWTIKALLKVTTDFMREKGLDSPRLNAEVLLAHVLNVTRVTLYLNFDQPVTEKEISGYRALVRRRIRREPLQYITGIREFWSLDFKVDARVLIPRPETELLVENALHRLKAFPNIETHHPRILDLGTGSGVIAVSLAREFDRGEIWASDISAAALKVARLNAERHGVLDLIRFVQGDIWAALVKEKISFDLILSNPPYVAMEEYGELPPEVREYEPRIALDGKERGMYYIKRILMGASDYMNPEGLIMLEMAPRQTEEALKIIRRTRDYCEATRIKDYSHSYRLVIARKA